MSNIAKRYAMNNGKSGSHAFDLWKRFCYSTAKLLHSSSFYSNFLLIRAYWSPGKKRNIKRPKVKENGKCTIVTNRGSVGRSTAFHKDLSNIYFKDVNNQRFTQTYQDTRSWYYRTAVSIYNVYRPPRLFQAHREPVRRLKERRKARRSRSAAREGKSAKKKK